MIELSVAKKESGQRLDKYLKRLLPSAGSGFLYKMLRKKNILLNGKKAEGKELLSEGDRISLFFSEETYQHFREKPKTEPDLKGSEDLCPLTVLYETEDLTFVDKPAGLLSQRNDRQEISANEILRQMYPEENGYLPSVLNRLDRNTSGILIGAKTLYGAREASRWLKDGLVEKHYHCLVHGNLRHEEDLTAYLLKDPKTNRVRIFDRETKGAVLIRAVYRPEKTFSGNALLSVRLITGKSHQIRAHLMHLGLPVLGDPKYGDPKENRFWKKETGLTRQLLHATELILPSKETIRSPYPEDFDRVMKKLEER